MSHNKSNPFELIRQKDTERNPENYCIISTYTFYFEIEYVIYLHNVLPFCWWGWNFQMSLSTKYLYIQSVSIVWPVAVEDLSDMFFCWHDTDQKSVF